VTIDRTLLTEAVGKLSERRLQLVLAGIDIVLGRWDVLRSTAAPHATAPA
jgi:hypothetical protein